MCWALGCNKSTTALGSVGSSTSKDNLKAGDIVLVEGHAIIFVQWDKADKSKYTGWDCGSSKGVSKRSIPWPFFNEATLKDCRTP
jgi:hypothetical protein